MGDRKLSHHLLCGHSSLFCSFIFTQRTRSCVGERLPAGSRACTRPILAVGVCGCVTMATTCHMWHLRLSLMRFRIRFLGHESHILRAHRPRNGSEGTFSSLQKFPANHAGVGFTKHSQAPYRGAPVILVRLFINGLRRNINLYWWSEKAFLASRQRGKASTTLQSHLLGFLLCARKTYCAPGPGSL